MDLRSCLDCRDGNPFNMLFSWEETIGDHHFGREIPFGVQVSFHHEGEITGEKMTLYNVTWADQRMGNTWQVTLDPKFPPMNHKMVNSRDFMFAHDLCCGLGGFTSALGFMGIQSLSAVDLSALALESFSLNHSVPTFLSDVGSTDLVFRLHALQHRHSCQPWITAGFPCQPPSAQGSQLREQDGRSATWQSLLKCAFWLQVSGLALECVPEALHDDFTQKAIHAFAKLMDFQIQQRVLHLHNVWPSRRSRWFAIFVPMTMDFPLFEDLPKLSPAPAVSDLMPYDPWPVWSFEEEDQLKWTHMELQAYRNPDFGHIDRKLVASEPLPTALHTWGSALYKCPCGCRAKGLSPFSLRRKGLRGVEITSGLWPHSPRHIHPRELQLLIGFSPCEAVLEDCRAQLCLQGNAVSPIQVIWIFAHIRQLIDPGFRFTPNECLRHYVLRIVRARDITWPSPSAGNGMLTLDFAGEAINLAFTTTQTVGSLLRAEASLAGVAVRSVLTCEGIELPEFAFLQERHYQLRQVGGFADYPTGFVPVFLVFLGEMRMLWAPVHLTYGTLIRWAGISEFCCLIDESSQAISMHAQVQAWKQIIVQQCPEHVGLDLHFREIGFGGLSDGHSFGTLKTSDSWISTGLWHLDQLVKSNMLMTWIGSDFRTMTVWLPSFAAAIVEGWPNTMEPQLSRWFQACEAVIYAIVAEAWGWNLVKLQVDHSLFKVTFFEEHGRSSFVASHVAYRAFRASKRSHQVEEWKHVSHVSDTTGQLHRVLHLLDLEFQVPDCIIHALHVFEDQAGMHTPSQEAITPTVSFDVASIAEDQQDLAQTSAAQGLSVGFMHRVIKAIFDPQQDRDFAVKVLVQESLLRSCPDLQCQALSIEVKPVFALILVSRHWILVHCEVQSTCLCLTVYDGLGVTAAPQIQQLADTLKQTWNMAQVLVQHKWVLPQRMHHTCGTVALGHLLLVTNTITYEQAMRFESFHAGFVACDPFQDDHAQIGFGPDDAVVEALQQILPSKGVPKDEVPSRAQAAIKMFGRAQVQKALDAGNVWAALKQLGNSKPKPFMWVTHSELQEHIKERSSTKFGAQVDVKRQEKQKEVKSANTSYQIDPTNLVLPAEVFVTNCGTPLTQLPLSGVAKNARGVAFATAAEAHKYMTEGKFISPEGLAILIVGPLPETFPKSLPMHNLRVPAIYKATNDPVLLECTSVQLGDQAVYQKTNKSAPEVAVFPSVVFRAHVFRDLWEQERQWNDLIEHPVRSLVHTFTLLRLCKDKDCQGPCSFFHPSLEEEEGIESGLLDVWGFKWAHLDGAKTSPGKAAVLSVYIRVPESSFEALHVSSGQAGVFFEPRQKDQPLPDPRFAVVWIPQSTLTDTVHRVKTRDDCLAACRLGNKYGIRCYSRNHEDLHATLVPDRPYVKCTVKVIYRLEPLPVGTQRQSLVTMLQSFGWLAKPLHPCAGSQGKAWLIGSEVDPPAQFIETQNGWVSVSKVRDQVAMPKQDNLIANARTKQHIKGGSSSASSSTTDPWQSGPDPWSGYRTPQAVSAAAPSAPSVHVQQKFEEVEQKLQDHVTATVASHLTQADQATSVRLQNVEDQIQTLVEHQTKMQCWIQDGSAKVQELRQDYAQVHQSLQYCATQGQENAAAIAGVVQDLGACTTQLSQQGQALSTVAQDVAGLRDSLDKSLDAYFTRQTEQIESLLAKRQRH